MKDVEILIISNKFDFGTDYICIELEKRQCNYLRINRDEFSNYDFLLDVRKMELQITIEQIHYRVSDQKLKSVYYRAPIYLRDIYRPGIGMDEQLSRTQWMAFIRNLTIFENPEWVNHPSATFASENKLLQLKYADQIGLHTPDTYVTNSNHLSLNEKELYIVKSLDTAVLRVDNREAFVYSNIVSTNEIYNSPLNLAPLVIQNYIGTNSIKIDVRVTVIGEEIFAVRILKDGRGISGDWRREKDDIEYLHFQLPDDIELKCRSLLKKLGLKFGAIDLIECDSEFFFLEINPTGEWAWLVESATLPIHERICDLLER